MHLWQVSHCDRYNITYRLTLSGVQPEVNELIMKHQRFKPGVPKVHFLQRANTGFDFGAHRAALDSEQVRLGAHRLDLLGYDMYVFLNDGTRGPFFPSYMPDNWHWLDAFSKALNPPVQLVGTSVVCLHPQDYAVQNWPYLRGPKVEGFAFAMSERSFANEIRHGTSFQFHKDKNTAIVSGEYNLSWNVFNAHGQQWSISSLLYNHNGVDFRDHANWQCNNFLFPTRPLAHGPGINIHPLEVLFHKPIWHSIEVGNPCRVSWVETETYTAWAKGQSLPPLPKCYERKSWKSWLVDENDAASIRCYRSEDEEKEMLREMYDTPNPWYII